MQAIPLAKGLSRAFRVPGGTSRGSLSMQARTLPPNKRSCSLNLSQQCPAWLSCGIRPAHSCISYLSVIKTAAPTLRVSLQSLEVRDANEFERAFDSMTRARADGL